MVVSPNSQRQQWLKARHGKYDRMVGASAAAAAVGFGKYRTPRDVFDSCKSRKRKRELSTFTKNAFEWGHTQEPRIISAYSRMTGWDTAEGRLYYADPYTPNAADRGLVKGDEHRFGVSLDARVYPYGRSSPKSWFGLECKAPVGRMYPGDRIIDEHMAQIQMQTAVANLQFIDYCAIKYNQENPYAPRSRSVFKRVYHCPEYCQWLLPKLRAFTYCLEKDYPPNVQADVVPHFPSLRVVDMITVGPDEEWRWNWDADIPREPRSFFIDEPRDVRITMAEVLGKAGTAPAQPAALRASGSRARPAKESSSETCTTGVGTRLRKR